MSDNREWGMDREELIKTLEASEIDTSKLTEEELYQLSWKQFPESDEDYYFEIQCGWGDEFEIEVQIPDEEEEASGHAMCLSKENPDEIYSVIMYANTRGFSMGDRLYVFKGGKEIPEDEWPEDDG